MKRHPGLLFWYITGFALARCHCFALGSLLNINLSYGYQFTHNVTFFNHNKTRTASQITKDNTSRTNK